MQLIPSLLEEYARLVIVAGFKPVEGWQAIPGRFNSCLFRQIFL
tara:strand:- start:2640 stop:2771 length:132 start_codon:yes stop_codon:yes gene_type:complete